MRYKKVCFKKVNGVYRQIYRDFSTDIKPYYYWINKIRVKYDKYKENEE